MILWRSSAPSHRTDAAGRVSERTYESADHDLRLTATHDGHVRLMAHLSNDPDDWPATTVITLDPSEEMTRAAEDELKVRQIQ